MNCPSITFLDLVTGTKSNTAARQDGDCIQVSPNLLINGPPSVITVDLMNNGGTVDATSCQAAVYWVADWGDTSCKLINPNVVGQTNPTPAKAVTVTSPPVAFTMQWCPTTSYYGTGTLYVQAVADPQQNCATGVPPAGTSPTDPTQPYNAELWCLILEA